MSDESESVIGSLPPPRAADVLFGPGEDFEANACISHWIEVDYVYTSGFRRAGSRLAQHVCETGSDQDFLVYPIVYLYRHHVELVLKAIVRVAVALLDREPTEGDHKALGGHDLSRLWDTARPLLNPVCALVPNPPFPDDDLLGIDAYIRQLHEHDPKGESFRYATTKPKRSNRREMATVIPSLNPNLKLVNIRAFAAAMEKLADYLEGIEGWFGDLQDAKAEWRRRQRG
ncbi:MAG TPA: hypothetical protein VNJ12_07110 [Candidatus Dormibacteraeota bacterium]|nr:hypothetical protein [Candidatus Dormibacteraeota bacterium]